MKYKKQLLIFYGVFHIVKNESWAIAYGLIQWIISGIIILQKIRKAKEKR